MNIPATSRKIEDPLQNVQISVLEDDSKSALSESRSDTGLDQTIIIGEMEEGNIFDNIKMGAGSPTKDDSQKIVLTHDELETFLTDLKLKHRAEIDAIMIE